jgi:OOP family OmpA-OmpF porin
LAHIGAGLISLAEPLQFWPNTAEFTDRTREALDQVVDILDANAALHVLIVGHTDAYGSRARNQALSEMRASAVRDYLVKQSKNPAQMELRLKSAGRGSSQPIDDNTSAVGRARNRRVEFLIEESKPEPPPK